MSVSRWAPLRSLGIREVWAVDCEFQSLPGSPPTTICLVAHELTGDKSVRMWGHELYRAAAPPHGTGPDTLFVAYAAAAEFGCYLALGWKLPQRVVDLYAEHRCQTNGQTTPHGNGLLGALAHRGLEGMDAVEKESMRQLALRGGPYSSDERLALLDYCESDVVALGHLFDAMFQALDWPRALHRGRYMRAVAKMERRGTPIDGATFAVLRSEWDSIQQQLIDEIDHDYGAFEGRTFKRDRWSAFVKSQNLPWPRLPSGSLKLDDNTFREMARSHPQVAPMRELRASLSEMRLSKLAVGPDHRNRTQLWAFSAITSRNQPSTSEFIFGPAVWLRALIQPLPGRALAYIDWGQQEFGIAAALSGDVQMMAAYESGDPYLEFAKQAGAVPSCATKETHGAAREQFKACVLAVQYGMGAESLAQRIGEPVATARALLRMHWDTYPRFWRWSDGVLDRAMLFGEIYTVFGWKRHVGDQHNPRSLRNFPMQGNGAEMLRLACILATERGLGVCAPVHDALLVEATEERIEAVVSATQACMAEASESVLSGFRLRSDAQVIRHPDRFEDSRGTRMWQTVRRVLSELDRSRYAKCPPASTRPVLSEIS